MVSENFAQCRLEEMSSGMQSGGRFGTVRQSAFEFLLGAFAGKLLMFGKGFVEAFAVHLETFFRGHFFSQFQREPVSLIQEERVFTADDFFDDMLWHSGNQFFKFPGTFLQSQFKLALFRMQLFNDLGFILLQFTVNIAEILNHDLCHRHDERLFNPELPPFTDGAADQAAEYIGLVNIPRRDAVGNDKDR